MSDKPIINVGTSLVSPKTAEARAKLAKAFQEFCRECERELNACTGSKNEIFNKFVDCINMEALDIEGVSRAMLHARQNSLGKSTDDSVLLPVYAIEAAAAFVLAFSRILQETASAVFIEEAAKDNVPLHTVPDLSKGTGVN